MEHSVPPQSPNGHRHNFGCKCYDPVTFEEETIVVYVVILKKPYLTQEQFDWVKFGINTINVEIPKLVPEQTYLKSRDVITVKAFKNWFWEGFTVLQYTCSSSSAAFGCKWYSNHFLEQLLE